MKQQLLRFGSVGVIVTLTDFLVLNVLLLCHVPVLLANIAGITAAMVLSFRLNQRHVFDGQVTSIKAKVLFFAGTAFSLYGLQTIIIYVLLHNQTSISAVTGLSSLSPGLSMLLYTNLSKVIATLVSATFNFVYYKKVIFVERQPLSEV